MEIIEITNYKMVYEDEKLSEFVLKSFFIKSINRLKNTAESVYKKKSGRFFVLKEDEIVGILGIKIVNKKANIVNFFVKNDVYKLKRILMDFIINELELDIVVEISSLLKDSNEDFYSEYGFIKTIKRNEALGDMIIYEYRR